MATSDPVQNYWSVPTDQLYKTLGTSANGLSSAEAESRLQKYGENRLKAHHKVTPLGIFLDQFKSPIVLILLFATIISAFVGDWVDAVIILIIMLGSALLSFYQEYNASSAAEKLRAQVRVQVTVIRDGKNVTVPTEQVVPGDVVLLSAGSLIPADSVVLEQKDVYVNQAVLTGETFPVEKKPDPVAAQASLAERTNSVFQGTSIRSGSAKALAIRTGQGTEFGQIAAKLELRPPETEFERGIRHLGYLLTEIMFVLVFVVFAINVALAKPVLDSLLFSIALAVGLTPQLLPAIINVNLSKGSQKMGAQGVIVRHLAAIENFGSMDVLCTDKTGTLTEGIVKLDQAVDLDRQPSDEVFLYAYLTAKFQTGLANPLDEAILATKTPDIQQYSKVDEVPYDFQRKRLSVLVNEGDHHMLAMKGALDSVLTACTHAGKDDAPLDDAVRKKIQDDFTEWSGQGFRVLGVAARHLGSQNSCSINDEHDMTFYGFLLFFDPPKADVKQTIADLEAIGVQLKMITGDNKLVARYAAETIGMKVIGVVTGHELGQMSEPALLHTVENTNIFAEVDPNQKERIIRAYGKVGHVVGYMGDGVNDAPALHAADVGISVQNAADVAKEAADFVLLKQDLSVLKQGIIQGRMTFANTLKYVFMATSANFGNMFSVAGVSLLLTFLPFLPKQLLLINFLTDLPELTIAGDKVDDDWIKRPRRWDIAFIRRFMLIFGLLSSVFDYVTFGVLILLLHSNAEQFRTGWFTESLVSAVLVVFVLRTRLPFTKSRPSNALTIVSFAVIGVVLLIPISPLAGPLGFVPLSWGVIALMIGISVVYFFSAEFAKRWFYRHNG